MSNFRPGAGSARSEFPGLGYFLRSIDGGLSRLRYLNNFRGGDGSGSLYHAMKVWFVVNKSDGRITGWNRSPNATEVPAGDAKNDLVETDEAGLALYQQLEGEMLTDGRTPTILHDGSGFAKSIDARPVVSIDAGKAEADAGAPVVLTFTRSDSFTGIQKADILGRRLKLDFVAGVATKTLRFESGLITQRSTDEMNLTSPFILEVVE